MDAEQRRESEKRRKASREEEFRRDGGTQYMAYRTHTHCEQEERRETRFESRWASGSWEKPVN
jgi:hypothetical protein